MGERPESGAATVPSSHPRRGVATGLRRSVDDGRSPSGGVVSPVERGGLARSTPRRVRFSGAASAPNRPAEGAAHHFEDFGHVLVGLAALGGGPDAALDVILEDHDREGIDGGAQGGGLLEDVHAVLVAFDHPGDTAHLALDPAQAPDELLLVLAVRVPEHALGRGLVGIAVVGVSLGRSPGRGRRSRRRGAVADGGPGIGPIWGWHRAGDSFTGRWASNDTRGEYSPRSGGRSHRLRPDGLDWLPMDAFDPSFGGGRSPAVSPTRVAVSKVPTPPSAPTFAHASEAELARILDYYQVRWRYEPHVFPILWNLDGDVVESFAPDFYLPDLDLYVELTTLRQPLVRKKNRKLRRLRELYPDIRIKLFYARDFKALMLKYGKFGLAEELSGTSGQIVTLPIPSEDVAAAELVATPVELSTPLPEPVPLDPRRRRTRKPGQPFEPDARLRVARDR